MTNFTRNIWKKYGFCSNPYDTKALSFFSPMFVANLFIKGKNSESFDLVTNILRSEGGARFVIEGEIGVGKTTFVNYHRFVWATEAQDKLFTTVQEISILPNWNLQDFLLNILSSLLYRIRLEYGENFILEKNFFKEIAILTKIYLHSEYDLQGQILGFGFGMAKLEQINVPKLSDVQLILYVQEMVKEIKKLGYDGIFLHFDNLELFASRNIQKLQNMFEDIRDSLQLPDVYFVFVANIGFFSEIISPLERVRSIFFGFPIQISPLSEDEVIEAIEKRYQVLSEGKKFIKPFEDTFIRYLYKIYHGKIRFIMDTLHSIVLQLTGNINMTLSLETSTQSFQKILLQKIEHNLSQREKEILSAIIQIKNFTSSKLATKLKIALPNMCRYLEKLLVLNFIQKEPGEFRSSHYKIHDSLQNLTDSQNFFNVSSSKHQEMITRKLSQKTLERHQKVLKLFEQNASLTSQEISSFLGYSLPMLRRDLFYLCQNKILCKYGNTKNSFYKIHCK